MELLDVPARTASLTKLGGTSLVFGETATVGGRPGG